MAPSNPPGVGSLLRQIGESGAGNVRIVRHDAVEVLEQMIAPATLAGINVFFPDPWHKTRHHKRRLVQAPFVRLLASRLRPGPFLHAWLEQRFPLKAGQLFELGFYESFHGIETVL